MRARLTVEGLKAAQDRIDAVGDRGRRPEPALRAPKTLLDLQQSERRKFRRPGRRASPEWVAEKRRRGLDPRTLRAHGVLESALTNATHNVKATVFNATLTWGIRSGGGQSDVYYAHKLAKGTSTGRKWRVVVIDKIARESIAVRVETYVADGDLR